MYQRFRSNIDESSEIIIFVSNLTTFKASNNFGIARSLPEIGLSLIAWYPWHTQYDLDPKS